MGSTNSAPELPIGVLDTRPAIGHSALVEPTSARRLTERERDVLAAVVARVSDGLPNLTSQVAGATVVGTCGCGCPTIHFGHGLGGIEKVADVAVRDTHDAVLLYVAADGSLDSLEYMWVGDSIPTEFPPPDELGSDNP